MDSDSLGSEDSVPLPEVPQILPTKSTDNVQSSRSKAAPSPVARKPSLAQPVSPARPFTNSGSPSNSSGLLSEMRPSRRLSQTAQPVKAAPVPPVKISPKKPSVVSVPKKNSKTLLIVGSSIGGLVLLGGIAAILILFVFNTNGKILETDLISGTSANTGFLYPRQSKRRHTNRRDSYREKIVHSSRH